MSRAMEKKKADFDYDHTFRNDKHRSNLYLKTTLRHIPIIHYCGHFELKQTKKISCRNQARFVLKKVRSISFRLPQGIENETYLSSKTYKLSLQNIQLIKI